MGPPPQHERDLLARFGEWTPSYPRGGLRDADERLVWWGAVVDEPAAESGRAWRAAPREPAGIADAP